MAEGDGARPGGRLRAMRAFRETPLHHPDTRRDRKEHEYAFPGRDASVISTAHVAGWSHDSYGHCREGTLLYLHVVLILTG